MRLLPWLALTAGIYILAGWIPGLRGLTRVPFLGFLLSSMLAAYLLNRWQGWSLDRRRTAAQVRDLGQVDTPGNQGKLGTLLLSKGKAGEALEPLRKAAEGEPARLEWRYRLGCCELELGRPTQAVEWLEDVVARDEEHGFGAALMRLAEALAGAGRHADALERLERFERNHGANPESAYRRGQALLELGDRERARRVLAECAELYATLPAAHQKPMRGFVVKAKALGKLG
ncbi:MAG: tetratricopeptide repeat protein [Planctomycetota bacterium]|jgi:tetratricopeptide (TPR) repeat protein